MSMNKPYAGEYDPETGEQLIDLGFRIDWNNFKMVHAIPSKEGMRFFCSKGHVAFYAFTEKKKGKRHCSKIVSYGQCLFPVEQVYWRSLKNLANRSFRIGQLNDHR